MRQGLPKERVTAIPSRDSNVRVPCNCAEQVDEPQA